MRAQLAILKQASRQLNVDLERGQPLFCGATLVEPHGFCDQPRTVVFFHSDGLVPGYPHQWTGSPRLGELVKACSIEPSCRVIALALDRAGAFNSDLIETADRLDIDIEVGILRQ